MATFTLPPRLLTAKEAAAYLGVQVKTLSNWRVTGRYDIPFIKMGSHVRYRPSDLEAFIVSRTVNPVAL